MADAIIIRTMNPNDITLEEAEQIGQAVRQAVRGLNLNCDVKIVGQQREGKGVTWFEVLHISLLAGIFAGVGKALTEEAAKELVKIVLDWARQRFKGRKSASKRPVYVAIYGPDGGVVKSVVVKNATDEPEDRTEADNKLIEALRKKQGGKGDTPKQ